MKKILLLFMFAIFILQTNVVNAIPAFPDPITYEQPDGKEITIVLQGDEYVHWAETLDGYTILQNSEGFYVYAVKNADGDLTFSDVVVKERNLMNERNLDFLNNLQKGLKYSAKQIQDFKDQLKQAETKGEGFPTTGTNDLLMILANFNNTSTTYTQSNFDNYMNQANYNGTGSFKDYYFECSYGQLTVNTTVTVWVTVPNTHDYYGPQANWGEFAYDAVVAADNAGIDFSAFDNDGDGDVDGVAIIHQGQGQEVSGNTNDIWSHSWNLASAGYTAAQRTFDGVEVYAYTTQPELDGSGNIATIGVMCHEFGHNLGAPDYYDTDYGTGGQYDGTGDWDMMASGSYNGFPSGSTPAHHNGFTKWYYYGWLTPTELNSGQSVTLNDIEGNQELYYYTTPSTNEYWLLENRQQTGFDAALPGHGMIIYHVDQDNVDAHDGSNDINATTPQYMYPVCANAAGDPPTYGTINGGGCPFPGTSSVTSFTDATTPSSTDWAGNPTNKPITNIAENAGVITFDFMGGDVGNPGSFTATASSSSQIDLSWTLNTNSDPVLVAWSSDGTFGTPTDGSTYSAGNSISGGGTVLQYSTGTSYSHTSLSASTTYYYKAWSYDGASYTSGATANATTLCSSISSFPHTENFEGGTIPNCWSEAHGAADYGWEVTSSYSSSWWTVPAHTNFAIANDDACNCDMSDVWLITPEFDFSLLSSANLQFASLSYDNGGTSAIFTIKYSINGGTSWDDLTTINEEASNTWTTENVDLSVLDGESSVMLAFHYNDGGNWRYGWAIDDIIIDGTVAACTYPTTQASSFATSSVASTSMTVSWTDGDGDRVLVVANEGSAVSTDPTDATSYAANAAFGSGDAIGTGYVVFNGDGSTPSVDITGLNPSTTYHFAVYEYNSTGNCYLIPGLTGSQSTTAPSGYNVTFTVDNGTNPVQGADVALTGYGTQTTDASGQTIFTNVGTATGIAYTVTATGYGNVNGSLDVGSSDVAESVTLIPDLITIYDIQYTTDPTGDSPLDGSVIRTSGIVTALKSSGFYMQDGSGAWNGILVYTGGAPSVSLADEVEVIGEVYEYFGETEISNPSSVSINSTGNTLPTAIALSTTDVNDEQYEGILVSITEAQVNANTTDPNVDWSADDGSGTVNLDENMYDPGYVDGNTYNITGVVRYSWNSYRIQPRVSNDVQVVFTVTFNVSDGSNPVVGADVTFADYGTLTTDASGQVIFTQIIPEAGLGYLIEAAGYDLANGSTDVVDADITENVTLNASPYCHAFASLNTWEFINTFEFGTINNATTGIGFGGYQDFTSISADIEPCSIYNFTITLGSGYLEDKGRIWIDWNQDGDFEDDGELVFESEVGTGPFTGSIEVPITATTGQTRMRVRIWDSGFEATGVNGGSCGNENYGEVEDYTVNVLPVPPAELTVSETSFDFGDVEVGNTSTEGIYTVYGAYLPNDVVITAPTGFEISVTTGAGFTNSITITPDNGSVPDTTIYARFAPTDEQSYTGNLTHVSTGATQQNIALNGYGYYTYTISGNLSYNDGVPTAMDNITLNLLDASLSPVDAVLTDASGNYSFIAVRNGSYFVSPDLSLTWDGVSAMDITAYKKHIGNIPGFVLSGLALESGDVNANGTVTGIDLVFVKQRILGDISSFASGDWLHSDNSVLVDAADATIDVQAMVYGDGNASYYTGAKSLANVDVVYEENMTIPEDGQFEIPVSVKTAMVDLASITLMFEFDDENVEINEIIMNDNNSDLTYSINEGVARMIYSTINPTDFAEDQELFYIKGQVLDASGDIEIANNTVGEFGDFTDNVLPGITLSAPLLTSPTGIGEGSLSDIMVYPNPTNAFINITNVANARVEICNVYGSLISSDVAEERVHKVDVSNLTTGTYLIKIYKDEKLIMRKFSVTK